MPAATASAAEFRVRSAMRATGEDSHGCRRGRSTDARWVALRFDMMARCSDYGSIATKCKAFVRAVHRSVWRLCCRQASREPLACAMKRPDVFARRAAARGRASLRTVNPGRAVDRWRMSQDTRARRRLALRSHSAVGRIQVRDRGSSHRHARVVDARLTRSTGSLRRTSRSIRGDGAHPARHAGRVRGGGMEGGVQPVAAGCGGTALRAPRATRRRGVRAVLQATLNKSP